MHNLSTFSFGFVAGISSLLGLRWFYLLLKTYLTELFRFDDLAQQIHFDLK